MKLEKFCKTSRNRLQTKIIFYVEYQIEYLYWVFQWVMIND